jgi:hypothetical protein
MGYGLDGRESIPGKGKWVHRVKRQVREADHSPPSKKKKKKK